MKNLALFLLVALSASLGSFAANVGFDTTTHKTSPVNLRYQADQFSLNATALTGTTPTLDWTKREYIQRLTADTTFAFANTPTDTNQTAVLIYTVIGNGTAALTNTANAISFEPTFPGIVPSGTNQLKFTWSGGLVHCEVSWLATATAGLLKQTSVGITNAVDGVDYTSPATQTGTHASPSTTNPLSPTWSGPLHTVWYGATGTINLPAVATYAGRAILIYNTGAFTITIDPNGSEVVVRDGNVQTGGVSFTLSSGAGNYVAIFCDGARWVTLGYKGTLAVGS